MCDSQGMVDWMTGKRYMDMESLWDWERDRGANEEELAPVHSMELKATEKLLHNYAK